MSNAGRPMSRGMGPMGGMAPPGPTSATLRPGTMMGDPSGGGLGPVTGPPGTRQNMATRNGTATRGGPGRQDTAAQREVMGVGAHTEVKVTDRPMTMQGLAGLKTGSLGPKRQVYDKTYYMLELRKRCQELQDELNRMNTEVDETAQDNKLYQDLEKRYDALVKTVRTLEGDLADHNLATDKQRTDTRPEEVHHMFLLMKQQNDQQRSDVDQIFLEKRSHEEELQQMQDEIMSIARASEERLNELHPDQHREYEVLQEENQHLTQELQESREELDQVNQRLNALEAHLRGDILRTRSQQLLEARKEATEELERLEIEARQCSMSVPEQREILLSKVKTDNADIVAAEKRNSELKLEKERLKAQIQEVTADAQERKDDNDQQKYEILFTKDKEMTQFIDSFDDSRKEEERKMKEKQDSISMLLENISKAVSLQAGVTPDGHLRDMEDELDFKSRQLQNSENTQNRLEAELTKRQGELEKIESLDTKISLELQQVEAKMRQYEEEIETKFDRVGDLRQDGEQRLRLLEERKRFLESRVSALRQQVGFLKLKNEGRKQELADDQAASNLDAHEQKIRQFGQTLHTLRSFIQQKTAESDFTGEMSSVLNIAGALNKILLETRRVA
mmetsp:Transcript_13097/g.27433  ORF Transcript_13097/g.27433 Transcript_13097/m.27433 type:complete len:621 (+) Transcript_13097:93-1955(+)